MELQHMQGWRTCRASVWQERCLAGLAMHRSYNDRKRKREKSAREPLGRKLIERVRFWVRVASPGCRSEILHFD